MYRATKSRNFFCLYINSPVLNSYLSCVANPRCGTRCEMVKGSVGSSLDNLFNPWFHLVDIGVHTIFEWLSARLSPTDDASQRPNAATNRTGKRSACVKMARIHAAFLVTSTHKSVTDGAIVGSSEIQVCHGITQNYRCCIF